LNIQKQGARMDGNPSTLTGSMRTIMLEPRGFFSWDYDLYQGSAYLSSISVSLLKERGEFTVSGEHYSIYHEGINGPFILYRGAEIIARASKPNYFINQFELEHEGRRYALKCLSSATKTFYLLEGETTVGTVRRKGLLSSSGEAMLSDRLALSFGIFAIWLVIVIWKKDYETDGAD